MEDLDFINVLKTTKSEILEEVNKINNSIEQFRKEHLILEEKIDELSKLVSTNIKLNSSLKRDLIKLSTIPTLGNIKTQKTDDEITKLAAYSILANGTASVSYIQRKFKIGYSRAGRIVDELESLGIIGQHIGSKARSILIDKSGLDTIFN